MRCLLIAMLCASLLSGGCATRGAPSPVPSAPDRTSSMFAYVQKLPVGSRVSVDLVGGERVRGTLMRAAEEFLEIQPATRIPEPPQRLPMERVLRVELETRTNLARTVAIGIAAGAAGTLGVLLILAAIFADD